MPNHISGEKDAKVSVNIDVKDMKDFHPDEICKKVEPLQELMEARERLKKLKYMVMNPDVRKALEGVLKEGGDSVGNLMSKLEAKS